MKYYMVFIKREFVRDAQAYYGDCLPDDADISDSDHEKYWNDVYGDICIIERYADSADKIKEQLHVLYPGVSDDIFLIYEMASQPQKCTVTKEHDDADLVAEYEYEHNDGDQIWSDFTSFYRNPEGSVTKVYLEGFYGKKCRSNVSEEQMVAEMRSIEKKIKKQDRLSRGGYSILRSVEKTDGQLKS